MSVDRAFCQQISLRPNEKTAIRRVYRFAKALRDPTYDTLPDYDFTTFQETLDAINNNAATQVLVHSEPCSLVTLYWGGQSALRSAGFDGVGSMEEPGGLRAGGSLRPMATWVIGLFGRDICPEDR